MTRVVLAAALAIVAVVVAAIARHRSSPEAPSQPAWAAPAQLDRADFDRPDAPQLVVVFSSATCSTCASMVTKAEALSSASVVVQEVEVTARPELHQRYGIDAVPITVVADVEGVVRASFVGPASAEELWASLA